MASIPKDKVTTLYNHFRQGHGLKYDEAKHCQLLIKTMLDPKKGRISSYCVDAVISESTFYNWLRDYGTFRDIYYFCKMTAREIWEEEGFEIKSREYSGGIINHEFEYWKFIGWTRFGVSRNPRLKIQLVPTDSPAKHYEAILKQASDGDFTASEFKQLMEAVNVGLNVHQVFELQKQIDELKSSLSIMAANSHVTNPFTDKGIEKTNQDTLANSVCE